MIYRANDYSGLRGLKGISDEQIEQHLSLYEGYVRRSNALAERLSGLAVEGKHGKPHFQELKRRQGWEFNGMRLHELYFEGLKPNSGELTPDHRLGAIAARQFGSIDAWKSDLLGVARMPGVGWAITYLDPAASRLMNVWIDQHESGHPAGCRPLVVLDIWEHAFSVYLAPTERDRYLEDLFANVDWEASERRIG